MRHLVVIIGGLILTAWWIEAYRLTRAHNRRERDRERESSNLTHITGGKKWWQEPPSDGPEEDH
jgi:hypothetical protein